MYLTNAGYEKGDITFKILDFKVYFTGLQYVLHV